MAEKKLPYIRFFTKARKAGGSLILTIDRDGVKLLGVTEKELLDVTVRKMRMQP